MRKAPKSLLLAVFLLSALFFASTTQVDAAAKPVLYVLTSAARITDQDTVSLTALAASLQGEPADQITISVNGDKTICSATFSCQKVVGPFKVSKLTWISYEIKATKDSATTIKKGSFLVNPVKTTTKPEFTKITTSGHQLEVGDTFDLKIFTKDKVGIAKIEIYLDGNLMDTCEGVTECGTTFGPFSDNEVGEHKYEFLVVNKFGNSIRPWGKYWVKETSSSSGTSDGAQGSDTTATPSTAYKYNCTDSDSGSNYFKKGSVAYFIYFNNNPAVGLEPAPVEDYCVDSRTLAEYSCDGKLTPSGSPKGGYFAVPTKYPCANGCKEGACIESPTSVDNKDVVSPNITISTDKVSATDNEKITFTARASDNKKVTKMNILVNAYEVKVCENTETCSYTGGPYPSYAGTSVSYGANAYDEAGNRAWTEYKFIPIQKAVGVDITKPIILSIAGRLLPTQTNINEYWAEVAAKATDESGKIDKMYIYISETGVPIGDVSGTCASLTSPAFCQVQRGGLLPGKRYAYWVEAYDAQGNKGVSSMYYLDTPKIEKDTISPVVSVEGKLINFTASSTVYDVIGKASDNSGKISKINLYVADTSQAYSSFVPVGSCVSSAVCEFTGGSPLPGHRYSYWAEAWDAENNKGVSNMFYLDIPKQ